MRVAQITNIDRQL